MSVITKVQKLLNLAMDEGATEAERQRAQEKADALMVEHMIEQSDLNKDDPSRSRVTSATWTLDVRPDFRSKLDALLRGVTNHAKVRFTMKFNFDLKQYDVLVVGMPEGIAYAERLWMVVFTELARNMYPTWDDKLSFDVNVYRFVRAGTKWQKIHEIAWKHAGAEFVPDPYPADRQPKFGYGRFYAGDGGRLKRAYNREQKRLGEEKKSHTQRHDAYRASYIASYNSQIVRRLRDIAEKSKRSLSVDDRDKFALACLSTEEQVDAEFYRMFPEFAPDYIHPATAAYMASEKARREAMSPEERAREDAKKKRMADKARKDYERRRKQMYDSHGWEHGLSVADSVNLNNDTEIKISRKEIS